MHTRHTAHLDCLCASLSLCARCASATTPLSVAHTSHDTDTADLYPHFGPACHFIHTALAAGHAALIHCQQGISRSAAIATAYLIRQHGLPLRDAYVTVKASRPAVKVNANFLRQLIRWEKEGAADEALNKRAAATVAGPSVVEGQAAEANKRKRPSEDETGDRRATDGKEKEAAATDKREQATSDEQSADRVAPAVAPDRDDIEPHIDEPAEADTPVSSSKRQRVHVEPSEHSTVTEPSLTSRSSEVDSEGVSRYILE